MKCCRSPRLLCVAGILGTFSIPMISLVFRLPGFISEMRRFWDGEDLLIRRKRRRKPTTILEVWLGTGWLGPDCHYIINYNYNYIINHCMWQSYFPWLTYNWYNRFRLCCWRHTQGLRHPSLPHATSQPEPDTHRQQIIAVTPAASLYHCLTQRWS